MKIVFPVVLIFGSRF